MLKYMILLICLCTALTNTVAKKPKTPSQATIERRGVEVINKQLKTMLPFRHKDLTPLIKNYNHALRLTHTQREPRLTEGYSRLGTQLTSPHFSRLANKLIRDQMDLVNALRPLGINTEGNNTIKRFSWIKPFCDKVDQMVDSISDPIEKTKLQKKVAESKLKIQQKLDFPNTFFPRKVSSEKARKQKVQLMQFVNKELNDMYQVKSLIIGDDEGKQEDLKHYLAFAEAHNKGILCTQPEYSRHKADETLASICKYISLPLIDKKTAGQYKANHPEFRKQLIDGTQSLNDTCNRTTDLLKELPPEIAEFIDNDLHDGLEIGYEHTDSDTDQD